MTEAVDLVARGVLMGVAGSALFSRNARHVQGRPLRPIAPRTVSGESLPPSTP